MCVALFRHLHTIVAGLMLIKLLAAPVLSAETLTPAPFKDTECVTCHTERDPDLVAQWRASPHKAQSGVGCRSCHGDRHEGANPTARKEESCVRCHAGPASHSYATSKHGVISRLEGEMLTWQQPLQRGNYRAPTCSYCHLHGGDHGDTMSTVRGPEVRHWICSGCHSPRYVREQFANGERQLKIADLKLAEGKGLIASAVNGESDALLQLKQSLLNHRRNVLYGVGHQSPDYQWWLGQPALDGDLIRIRETISKSYDR